MFIFLKWLAGVSLTLILVVAIAIIVVPRVVDPNDYREDIISLVKDKTGRDMTLDGDLSVSVFPWLGIKIQGMSFGQPSGIGGEMLSVDAAQLRVKLMPLFSKRVEVDTVVLESPRIHIVTLANGVDSFSDLGEPENKPASSSANTAEPENGAAAMVLLIQGVELSNGKVIIEDRAENSTLELSDIELVSGNLIGDALAEITFSGRYKDVESATESKFTLDGFAKIDTETFVVAARDLNIKFDQEDLSAEVDVATLNFSEQNLVNLQEVGVNLSIKGLIPSNPDVNREVQVVVPHIDVDLNAQTLKAGDVILSSGDVIGAVTQFSARSIIDQPEVSGRLEVSPFNAVELLSEMRIEYQSENDGALEKIGFSASFSGSSNGVALKELVLNIDKSTLSGKGSVANFGDPKIEFDLKLDNLNLDGYLPVSNGESTEPVSSGSALVVPMAAFKGVNANGRFRAAELVSGGLDLNNIDVTVVSSPGNVTITPTADLYEGKLGGDITYSESKDGAQLKVDNEIGLVALGEMLNAADITDQLSGFGRVVLDLLITERNGVQNNEGTITLFAKEGAIKGVDIKGIVDQGYATYRSIKGKEPESESGESEAGDETRFAELLGTFHLKDNILKNDDFSMKAPLFRVSGQGEIDLDTQTLNYLANFSVVNSSNGQGGEAFEELAGLTIPIRLSGDLEAPNYSIDMKELYNALLKKEIDEKKGEYLQEKLGVEGGENLSTKDVLKQLLLNEAIKDDEPEELPIQDVGSGASDTQELVQPSDNQEEDKSAEDQLKDDLKRSIIESLFD